MTCLEHLIENTLVQIEKDEIPESYSGIIKMIESDINFKNAGITAKQCWEICQYVYYSYLSYMKENKEKEE